jgi:uncharacterized protein DUF6152
MNARRRPRRDRCAALTFACITTLGAVVAAHHSQTGFDPTQPPIELKGTVAEYRWRNPHVLIFWDVKDKDGNVERWVAEFASVSTSLSRGLTKNTFTAGEEITVTCIRARAGGPVCAQVKKLLKSDGTQVNAAAD